MVDVVVGIPTYNGSHRVDWLLKSISIRTGKTIEYKIVICDDSGKKEHQKKTELVVNKWKSFLSVELLINHKNTGVPYSWNKLVKSQDSRNVILINDDVIVAKNWLENMTFFLDNNLHIGAACYNCATINENETEILQQLSNPTKNTTASPTPKRILAVGGSGCGCFFGFRRDKYNIVEGFDENYFALREETDFYTSLLSRGYPIYQLYCPTNFHMFSRTFRTAPEMSIGAIYPKSIKYYFDKWKGDPPEIQKHFLSRIPSQKIKWMCDNKIYEN